MSRITVSLLGTPRLEREGEPIPIDRHKALALLAFLVITNKPHRRDTLAALFWSDYDQTRGRAAVRRALASLNKAIPGSWWDTDRETIGLNYKNDASFWLDVNHFHVRLAECGTHGHAITDVCPACLDALTDAVALYRGDFLHGFTLRDSPDFDDWQFAQTESLRRDLSSALERLARLYAAQSNFPSAINASRRWLLLDPLNEPAHRQLMQILVQSGERHAALRQYVECVRVLERELGVAPEDETTQLYEAIKAGQLSSTLWTYALPHTQPTIDSHRINFTSSPPPAPQEKVASPFDRLIGGQLIGRESEMGNLKAVWNRVNMGETRVLLVSGEPGIGKSRFAREIITKTKSSTVDVLTGQCHAEESAPYAPIAQIIQNVFTIRKFFSLSDHVLSNLLTLTPELASSYPNLQPAQTLDPQSAQRLLFESVSSCIVSFMQTNQNSLLLFIEDVHWADTATLLLLSHVARAASMQKLKLLILLTYRDAESDLDEARGLRDVLLHLNREGLADHIRLPRLNREHTKSMLGMMLGTEGDISTDFSNAIFDETEGNPFFIEEICKALIEAGDLYYAGGHWRRAEMASIKLPQNVRSAILSRVEKLPQDVQEVLRLAAIIGREFDFETIKSASESEEVSLLAALDRAERTQLVQKMEQEGNLRYAFAHALIPFALREYISGLRRQQMHARVAQSLEHQRPDDVESLAYHFIAAGMRAKSVEYSRQSAMRAEKVYAYNSAIQHLQIALEMLDVQEDVYLRVELLEGLADLHFRLNQNARAIPIYLEALQIWRGLPDADVWIAVRLQRKVGEATTSMNQFADYQRFATTSRASLEGGLALVQDQAPHPETIRLLRTLSHDAWYITSSADWDAAERYAQSAVTMAEQLDLPVELSSALESLSLVYGARGQFRERVEVCQRRSRLTWEPRFTEYRERINISYQLGRALLSVGEYEAALDHAKETENLSAAIQDVATQVNAMTLQSQCLFPLDRWDDLLAMDDKLREIQAHNAFERLGVALCFHTALVSAVNRLRGEHEQAGILREEAYGIMTKIVGPPEQWVRNQRY